MSRQRTIQKIIYTNFKFLIIGIWQNSNVKLLNWECGPNHVNLRIGQCWLCNFGKEETSTWAMWTSQFGKVELANMKIQLCKNLNIWYSITILLQQFKSPFFLTLSIVNFSTNFFSLIAHYSIWRRTITFGGGERKNTPKLWKHWYTYLHGLWCQPKKKKFFFCRNKFLPSLWATISHEKFEDFGHKPYQSLSC